MAVTETALKNHEELFPGHQSRLTITDPELIEMFDNIAFDEVVSPGDLEAALQEKTLRSKTATLRH